MPTRSRSLRSTWIMLVVLLVTALYAVPARAHAALVRSDPPDNAVLAEPPAEIRLWFNEPISPEFSTARLLDLNGQELTLQSLRTDADDPYVLILVPPVEMESGAYSINWNVLSEADGHTTRGLVVFGVGEATELGAAADAKAAEQVPLAEVILRWLNYGLLAAIFGVLAVLLVVLPDRLTGVDQQAALEFEAARNRMINWARRVAVIALLVGVAWFGYQFLVLLETVPEGASPLKVAWQLLGRTRWGTLWLARQAITLALVWLLTPPVRRLALPVGGLLATALLVIQAGSGHAAAIATDTALVVGFAALHLVGISFWVGGLLAIAVGMLPVWRKNRQHFAILAQATWGRFSAWAAFSVALIVATGLFSTAQQVRSPDALLASIYGRAIIGKVLFMLLMGFFGLVNAAMLHPRLIAPLARWLRRPEGWRLVSFNRLPALVLFELLLAGLVMVGASVATSVAPARGPEYYALPENMLDSESLQVDDLLINFSAKPNIPGPNVFTVRAISQRRPAPYEILRVILRFTYLDQDMGTTTADAELLEEGVYRLGGNYFTLAGPWEVEVAVRRNGVEDSVARFNWMVPAASSARPVIISNQPWKSDLSLISVAMISLFSLTGLVLVLWRLIRPRRSPSLPG